MAKRDSAQSTFAAEVVHRVRVSVCSRVLIYIFKSNDISTRWVQKNKLHFTASPFENHTHGGTGSGVDRNLLTWTFA